MNTSKHNVALEQDKLKILQMDAATKALPFTRLSPEQTSEIREVEDGNFTLETNIFAREKLIEKPGPVGKLCQSQKTGQHVR